MNMILSFAIEVGLTLILTFLLVRYLHPFLHKILLDLCGTEDRARFWTAFSNLLLIGMPLIFSLNYRPATANGEELFFEMAEKLSGNLGGLLVSLIGIGLMVSVFALFAPKTRQAEAK
jgi:hypothetical protein